MGLGIYATRHGWDHLTENWPSLYQPEQGANLPTEELLRLERGADYGWPECYFDDIQQKLVLAPEYGGDGGQAVGPCAEGDSCRGLPCPLGAQRSPALRWTSLPGCLPGGGAFIAFHGSWNRAPFPQGGYNMVFQPFVDGKPTGTYVVFADGFAGKEYRGVMPLMGGAQLSPAEVSAVAAYIWAPGHRSER
jgi:glucose/arabinose dehydrogenase